MSDIAAALTLVGMPDPADACDAAQWPATHGALPPDLGSLGLEQSARRGDPLPRPRSEPGLRLVTRGILCLTHAGTGLCTAIIGQGAPAGPAGGLWMTDGAFVDVGFETLRQHYGGPTALAVWMQAAELSRAAVEAELVCFVRHPASRRFARWMLALMKDADTTVITQTELARLGGLQRTSVSASMTTLQLRGALKVMRGRIAVQDRAALEREACGCGAPLALAAETGESPPDGASIGSADGTLRFAG